MRFTYYSISLKRRNILLCLSLNLAMQVPKALEWTLKPTMLWVCVLEQKREKYATGSRFYPTYSVITKTFLTFFSLWAIFSCFSRIFLAFLIPTCRKNARQNKKREEK